MGKRSFILALAGGLLACSIGAREASAGSVNVLADEGTFSFQMTENSAGNVTIAYSNAVLTDINGSAFSGLTVQSAFSTATVVFVLPGFKPPLSPFTSYSVSEGTATKMFGTGVGETPATLMNNVSQAFSTTGFLNLTGALTVGPGQVMSAPPLPDFNFSTMNGGAITLTYNQVGADFTSLINGTGPSTISGTGAFTEAAVPEPASLALLGIGMTGFLAFRRFFKRPVVTA